MTNDADNLATAARTFRDLVAEQDVPTTARGFMDRAESLVATLNAEQVRIAAAFYFVRMLKERHRDDVARVERKATRQPEFKYIRTAEAEEAEARIAAELFQDLARVTKKYADDLRMQWDADLLASTFAMPDGTLVSWGEATVEQHEARRAMLLRNAQGNVEAAARHAAAIRELTNSRAAHLDQLLTAAA